MYIVKYLRAAYMIKTSSINMWYNIKKTNEYPMAILAGTDGTQTYNSRNIELGTAY